LTRGKIVNDVCEDLTEGTTLMHIMNLGTKLRQSSKWVPLWNFWTKMGMIRVIKPIYKLKIISN